MNYMAKTKEIIEALAQHLEELDDFRNKHVLPDPSSKEGIEREISEVKKIKSIFSKDFKRLNDSIEEIKTSLQESDNSIYENLESIQEDIEERFEEVEKIYGVLSKLEKEQLTSAEMHKLGLTNLGSQLQKTSEDLSSEFYNKFEEIRQSINKHKEESSLVLIEKDGIIDSKFLQLEKDLKKFASGIYEYGSSFSISVNGTYIGTTSGVNFKAGTNVTITQSTDSQGIITVTFSASGGGAGTNFETPSGNLGQTSFTVLNTPKYIVSDGVTYFAGNGYSLVGLNITMDIAPTGFIKSAY